MSEKNKYYIWVAKKTGVIMSTTPVCPIRSNYDKISYMGYTYDLGYPKKMNTGRIIKAPQRKARIKPVIKETVARTRKTGTVLKKQ